MLEVNAQRRISMADVLQHPWCTAEMPFELATLNRRLQAAKARTLGGTCRISGGGGTPVHSARDAPTPRPPVFSQGANELRELVRLAATSLAA